MFGKKSKKINSVFRKSGNKNYIDVHMSYLISELEWMKRNTTLDDVRASSTCQSRSSSVQMIDHLLIWMGQREKPFLMFWGDSESDYKRWVGLRRGHWLVDHDVRAKLIREKLI